MTKMLATALFLLVSSVASAQTVERTIVIGALGWDARPINTDDNTATEEWLVTGWDVASNRTTWMVVAVRPQGLCMGARFVVPQVPDNAIRIERVGDRDKLIVREFSFVQGFTLTVYALDTPTCKQ